MSLIESPLPVSELLDLVANSSLSVLSLTSASPSASFTGIASQIAFYTERTIALESQLISVSSAAARRLTTAIFSQPGANRRKQNRYPHAMNCRMQIGRETAEIRTRSIGLGGMMVDLPISVACVPGQTAQVWLDEVGSASARICNGTPEGLHIAFQEPLSKAFNAVLKGLLLRLETENVFDVVHVRELAMVIEQAFERGLQSGRIKLAALMSARYTLIPGTDPQQFLHPALAFFEDVLPDLQERYLRPPRGMTYALATDRSGYVPVHNKRYCAPQRPDDPAFNLAFARNRRLFDETTTIAGGPADAAPCRADLSARYGPRPISIGAQHQRARSGARTPLGLRASGLPDGGERASIWQSLLT